MASPQRLAYQLTNISSRSNLKETARQFLSPRTPRKSDIYSKSISGEDQLSPLNIDTPNKRKILNDGLPEKHYTVLGSGGFGRVYKAFYRGNQVAAKILKTQRSGNAINSEKHASQFRHSNIVRILSIDEGASLSLITMELCGVTLQDRLDETTLTKVERVNMWKDVAQALGFCHKAGVVHADVKPKNILIATDGRAKLTDFGSSVLVNEQCDSLEPHGTPGYTAPEVLKGSVPTPAADIYSLAVVAWQMLSRQMPFQGLHIHTVIYLSAKGLRPDDTDMNDEFNGKYKSLYKQMWSQNTEERPVIHEVIKSLGQLIYLS